MVLGIAAAAAVALYFSLVFFVFPQYQMETRRPEAVVTDIAISKSEIALGQSFTVTVTGTNSGQHADMQIVSVSFPNLTRSDGITVLQHDFAQTPVMVNAGDQIGSGYSGTATPVAAQYASVEAFSRPWEGGRSYSISMEVTPETEGRFAVFVKAVAFPHSWDGAHWPSEGIVDHQQEFVQVHYVEVTNP
jgi:hypothetical protein